MFSVIIPTYNRADKLKRCLASLETQSYKDFEVIVCDDGSVDNTADVVKLFNGKLNLKYIKQHNWGGPARPRNSGIKESVGEWICFLDADDWWKDNKLEEISKYVEKGDVLYHDLFIMDNHERQIGRIKSRQLKKPVLEDLLINTNAIPNSSCCVRKDILIKANGFTEKRELIGVEDNDLWLKIAKFTNSFYYIPEKLGYYSVGEDNLTLKDEKQITRLKELYNGHIINLTDGKKQQATYALDYLIGRLKFAMKNYSEANIYFRKAVKAKSFSIKLKSFIFLIKSVIKPGETL